MLDRFSERCLLILDGLDEHGLGKNKEVLKMIRNEKLIRCGIIVSSRPHSTREVQIYFLTVIRVDGFTETEAEKFVSCVLSDISFCKQVMEFRSSDSREQFPVQQCPILLSFLCFLVANQQIELSNKTINLGDIYLYLVKCMYKKFVIRKAMEFESGDFIQVMKSVGKLSLQTLTFNNPLLQGSEVLRMVGNFAFEYGLFVGHEDLRLFDDPTADIYVAYAHRSIEELFGSFGFIQALNDGQDIDDVLGSDRERPIFMVNPLFLSFCLWILKSLDFEFHQRDECYDNLTSYVAKRIDSNPFVLKFFCDILNKCEEMNNIFVPGFVHIQSIEKFVKLLRLENGNFISRLRQIVIESDQFELEDDNVSLKISLDLLQEEIQALYLLLNEGSISQRNPQIHLVMKFSVQIECDIIPLLSKHIKESVIINNTKHFPSLLTASREFPHCPNLTEITTAELHIDDSVISALRRAVHSGKLPCLKRIEIENTCRCNSRLDLRSVVEVTVIGRERNRFRRDPDGCRFKFKKFRSSIT